MTEALKKKKLSTLDRDGGVYFTYKGKKQRFVEPMRAHGFVRRYKKDFGEVLGSRQEEVEEGVVKEEEGRQ